MDMLMKKVMRSMNNHRFLYVIIRNDDQNNQLLINATDAICNNTVLDLASDTFDTKSINMDNEYLLYIIIGNTGQLTNQLFINAGDGTFHNAVDLPTKLATIQYLFYQQK